MACQDLAMTSRSLDRMRDTMSAVGPLLLRTLSRSKSAQSCYDNCDMVSGGCSEHLTVEFHKFEERDSTVALSTTRMDIKEALKLFHINTVLLTKNNHGEEWQHLVCEVIGVGVANLLAKLLPDSAGKVLRKHVPRRHSCVTGAEVQKPARIIVEPPHPYDEKKNADMVKLCLMRQRKYLRRVACWKGNDPAFMADLKLIEDAKVDTLVRKEAEVRVKEVCLDYGEDLAHGDLLTVQKQDDAKSLMSGSTTAFGRMEFLGMMRLGLLHAKMKKVCVDMQALMPNVANFEDQGCLAYLAQLAEKTNISNRKEDIKKDDSSFERHDQFYSAVAGQALANMWQNWVQARPSLVEEVVDKQSAVDLVLQMLNHFGILERLTYDPDRVEEQQRPEDDLFEYYRELVVRFLPSLALDLCEEEGDALGLLAVERLLIGYMLASNLKQQNVKYGDFLLFDVIKFESSSARTKQRMRDSCVVNVSGSPGGGMFWDKVTAAKLPFPDKGLSH